MLEDEMMDVRAAALFLGMSPGYLNHLRFLRKGPKSLRVGKVSVRYMRSDLEEFKENREKVTFFDEGGQKLEEVPTI